MSNKIKVGTRVLLNAEDGSKREFFVQAMSVTIEGGEVFPIFEGVLIESANNGMAINVVEKVYGMELVKAITENPNIYIFYRSNG